MGEKKGRKEERERADLTNQRLHKI